MLTDARMCIASTAHITEKDNELLREAIDRRLTDTIIVYGKDDGWVVFVDDDFADTQSGHVASFRLFGFSEDFVNLMRQAASEGYWWLLLDADAPFTDGLAVHYW